ncbi:C39 family peptidase [Brevibacillus ginsengisoli]|uniref:C39 family peptidase n=1 Tax=Brevibacillus ginsengisoli TaxID=363854 RepID=UPI003CF2B6A4
MKTLLKKKIWKMSLLIMLFVILIEFSFFLPSYLNYKHYSVHTLLQAVQGMIPKSSSDKPKKAQPVPVKKYAIYHGDQTSASFNDATEAILFAKKLSYPSSVVLSANNRILWSTVKPQSKANAVTLINAPYISQLPDLRTGCEVTTLAMLLQYSGYQVNKLELAKKIDKDPTPLTYDSNKNMWWGNPHKGYVGEMLDGTKPSFGVFNKPIEGLARKYAGDRVINLTGMDFSDVLNVVRNGNPVWVIVTTTFSYDDTHNIDWMTADGPIHTTRNEHSVLLTGVDDKYVYMNDPLDPDGKNRKRLTRPFQESWEQMGKQAITILK